LFLGKKKKKKKWIYDWNEAKERGTNEGAANRRKKVSGVWWGMKRKKRREEKRRKFSIAADQHAACAVSG